MSAKDIYHELVKRLLIRDGWTITHDPLDVNYKKVRFHIDLGAEQLFGAQRENVKIAVEVKSFVGGSAITDFYLAFGQYDAYSRALIRVEPDRIVYLAMPLVAYRLLFVTKPIGELFEDDLNLVVFDPDTEEIVEWIPPVLTTPSFNR